MKHLIFAALAAAAVGFSVPASASTSILRPELATATRTAAPQLQKASPAPTVVAQEKKENGSAESSSGEKENGAAKTEEQKEEDKKAPLLKNEWVEGLSRLRGQGRAEPGGAEPAPSARAKGAGLLVGSGAVPIS